jgi:hypothetical protein
MGGLKRLDLLDSPSKGGIEKEGEEAREEKNGDADEDEERQKASPLEKERKEEFMKQESCPDGSR